MAGTTRAPSAWFNSVDVMDKPIVKGPVDGNAFAVLGAVKKALKEAGQGDKVAEFMQRATAGDYNTLLSVAMEYVDFDLDGGAR